MNEVNSGTLMTNFRLTLTAALIAATLTGCSGVLPNNPVLTLKPTAKGGVKAVLKPVAPPALRQAPSVTVMKGAAPAEVQGDEAAAATADADLDLTLEQLDAYADGGYQLKGLFADLGAKLKGGLKNLAPETRRAVLVRRTKRQGVVKARGAVREDLKDAFKKATWVDNGDGTKSKSIDLTSTVAAGEKAFGRHLTGTITRDAETDVLLKAEGALNQTLPSGATLVVNSARTLQADGSYSVVRHSLATLKGGRTRTADHTRTIGTDGQQQGQGTLTWKSPKGEVLVTRTWTFAGNEDAVATDEIPAEETGGEAVGGEETSGEEVLSGAEG